MGWLDGWWKSDDPLNEIDPTLREYLKKQAPQPYRPAAQPSPSSNGTYREKLGLTTHNDPEAQLREIVAVRENDHSSSDDSDERPLPKESLFQDGRYKHLWKTYRPMAEVEESGKSDQEKILDIVRSYRDRQAEVSRAAIENCVEEQWAVTNCFRTGGWKSRMTMCREENRALGRCVEMQARFLKALGYNSMLERPKEEGEKIQMHADELYHRMIEHERAVEDAKEKGLTPPPMPSIVESLPKTKELPHVHEDPVTLERLPEKIQSSLVKERLEGLEGIELEVAKRELDQFIALNQDLFTRVHERFHEERFERMKREEEGTERIGDRIKRYFDFRKYDEGWLQKRAAQNGGEQKHDPSEGR